MFELIFNGSKLTFSLMWIFGLPLFVEMEAILGLWLKEVPENAILFTRLGLIESLIVSISLPLTTAARAPGKMKKYELILGSIQILIFWYVLDLCRSSLFVCQASKKLKSIFRKIDLSYTILLYTIQSRPRWRFINNNKRNHLKRI